MKRTAARSAAILAIVLAPLGGAHARKAETTKTYGQRVQEYRDAHAPLGQQMVQRLAHVNAIGKCLELVREGGGGGWGPFAASHENREAACVAELQHWEAKNQPPVAPVAPPAVAKKSPLPGFLTGAGRKAKERAKAEATYAKALEAWKSQRAETEQGTRRSLGRWENAMRDLAGVLATVPAAVLTPILGDVAAFVRPYANPAMAAKRGYGMLEQIATRLTDNHPTLRPALDRLQATEQELLAEATAQVKANRLPTKKLTRPQAEKLYKEALARLNELPELTTDLSIHSDTVAEAHGESHVRGHSSVHGSIRARGVFSSMRGELDGHSTLVADSFFDAMARQLQPEAVDYVIDLQPSARQIRGLPASARTYHLEKTLALHEENKTLVEARLALESVVRVREIYEKLAQDHPDLAVAFKSWATFSTVQIRQWDAREYSTAYEVVGTLNLNRAKPDLLALKSLGLIDPAREAMLRGEAQTALDKALAR